MWNLRLIYESWNSVHLILFWGICSWNSAVALHRSPGYMKMLQSQMFSMTAPGRNLVNSQNQQPEVWLGEQMTLVPRHQVTVKVFPSDAPESRDETSNEPQQGLQAHLDQGWESQGGLEDTSKGQCWAFSWGPHWADIIYPSRFPLRGRVAPNLYISQPNTVKMESISWVKFIKIDLRETEVCGVEERS